MLYRIYMSLVLLVLCSVVSAEPVTKATIRQDGTLLIDDKPIFPIGIFTATIHGEYCQKMADLGFNMVSTGGDVADDYFDNAYKAGLYVVAPHYNWATFRADSPDVDLTEHEAAGFKQVLRYRDQVGRNIQTNMAAWDARPGVFGWYIAEEPKANFSEPLEAMHEYIKSHSPTHITTMVSAEKVWFHHFRRATDALMVDIYPYRPGDRVQPERLTYDTVAYAVEQMQGKPVWLMAQGGCMWKNWNDFPPMTEANFRNQAYLGLIGGAKGYWLFSLATMSHFGKLSEKDEARQWQRLGVVVRELKKLSPILCDGRVDDEVRIDWKSSDGRAAPPLTRVLDYYGSKYLLVANIGHQPVKAQIVGTNYGNPHAFAVQRFTGSRGLRVLGDRSGQATQTVNQAKAGKFPTIQIAPGASGCFKITRVPSL